MNRIMKSVNFPCKFEVVENQLRTVSWMNCALFSI